MATAAGVALLVAFAGSTGMYIHATRIPDDQAPTLTSGSVITAEAPLPANDPVTPVVARDGALQLDIFQDFKYVATGWPMGLSVSQTAAGGVDRRPYEDLGAEPHYVSDEPLYGYLPLGNGADSRITYVIDELERPTWIVYVDKNNNEDLTDDGPPYQNEGTGKLATAMSLTIVLSTASGKTITAPYHLWFWVNERSVAGPGLPKLTPRFYARCHYTGEVDLGGHIYRAVAFEYDRHNGLFAENGIWIDLDADGELQKAEHFQHGDAVRIGDDIFRIRLGYP